MTYDLRCHRCSHFMGESSEPVEFSGLFKRPRDREQVKAPRSSWRCPSCGWTNVFKRVTSSWREVEMKG